MSADLVLCHQVSHLYDAAGSMIHTVTSGAQNPSVSLEHYPRWHSNAWA